VLQLLKVTQFYKLKIFFIFMDIGIRVGDVMTRDFISVKPETSLLTCAKLMIKKRVGSLIIQEGNKLKGIVTEKDIVWAVTKKSNKDLDKIKCSDISPRKMTTIKPSADLMTAIKLMQKSKFRRLPVLINDKLVGMLTLKDILRIEPALFEIAQGRSSLSIKEEREKIKKRKARGEFKFGLCEECGREGIVESADGKLLCDDCIDKM
jgi:CBS domain-containing protein